jgi:HSP20 family protein
MSLATRTRFPELETLRNRVDRLFADFANWPQGFASRVDVPVDVQEVDNRVIVKATIPGYKAEDIDVEVTKGVLSIHAESREERDNTCGAWHMQERFVGSVERVLRLPVEVRDEPVKAEYKDGVLTITLEKTEPAPRRKVEVTAG